MRLLVALLLVFSMALALSGAPERPTVGILVGKGAPPPEVAAAKDLVERLSALYPSERISLVSEPGTVPHLIVLGTSASVRKILPGIGGKIPSVPGGFLVTAVEQKNGKAGVILGADSEGVANGVYRLLEELGFGFYLSFETKPPARKKFSFDGWKLAANPLVPCRIVFDWHNFLSGCSAWTLGEWNGWMVAALRMGYNTIMVHAYGNNPMAGFVFEGKDRSVGFLPSSRIGRDWANMHVNDVRRLYGGGVFPNSTFGSEASVEGSDAERTRAARELMGKVFAHAAERGMKIIFSVDIDTKSANPQESILLLPESARFRQGNTWLADPESPEGYVWYKAMVDALLSECPAMTMLVPWTRNSGTPWNDVKFEEMPARWQKEYRAIVKNNQGLENTKKNVAIFAQSKVVRAMRRALDESGHKNVRLGFGSWEFDFLPAADKFMPRDVALIGLDYNVLHEKSRFTSGESRKKLAEVGGNRPLIPIAWAHHDDGNYMGRPFTPFPDFYDCLVDMKCDTAGFGVIHWTTRPLDLYFKSMANQVWSDRKNEPLAGTVKATAEKLLPGNPSAGKFAGYLLDWITTSPKFGRATTDTFLYTPLKLTDEIKEGFSRRGKLLDSVDIRSLDAGGQALVGYFKGLEKFATSVFETDRLTEEASDAIGKGDYATARSLVSHCDPEKIVEDYAAFSSLGGITPGELGLIVSMNTRWISHLVRMRQILGMEPVRINFGATSHEPLAQSAGRFTFYFTPSKQIWETLGSEETGFDMVTIPEKEIVRSPDVNPDWTGIFQSAAKSASAMEFNVGPILDKIRGARDYIHFDSLAPGKYLLKLLLIEPEYDCAGRRVFDLEFSGGGDSGGEASTVRFPALKTGRFRLLIKSSPSGGWCSVSEISMPGQKIDPAQVVASGTAEDFPTANAFDGEPATRCAFKGKAASLEWAVDPAKTVEEADIMWYSRSKKGFYNFELQAQEGATWKTVASSATFSEKGGGSVMTIDPFKLAGAKNKPVVFTTPVELKDSGKVSFRIVPHVGGALICGIVLEPVVR